MYKIISSNNFLLLLILSSIWGSAFIAIKISVASINPVSVASGRLIIGALLLYAYFRYKKYTFNPDYKTVIYIFFIGLTGSFIPFFLISWSETYIQSNTAGLLISVAPIFTLLFAHYMTKDDKFTLRKFFAIIIGFIGVSFIFGLDSLIQVLKNESNLFLPKFAIIVAAFGYVISAIMAYNLRSSKTINSITFTTFVTIFAALISLPFMLFVEVQYSMIPSLKSLVSLFYLGLFPTAIAFVLRFHIISKTSPTYLSYVAYLIPGFAIFWGYIFLKETINIEIIFGLFFILVGIFIGHSKNEKNI